jgi:hypothetical protein
MNPREAERFNAKYKAFYLIRYSPKSYRFVQRGKPRPTIQSALAAAKKMDARDGHWMTFIDVVPPKRTS